MAPGGHALDAQHLSPEAVERYLRRHGLAARRSLSQNHLADGAVLAAHPRTPRGWCRESTSWRSDPASAS